MRSLAWLKGRNSRLISATLNPIPLSATVNTSRTFPRGAFSLVPSRRTLPRSVNLTALSIKFSSAARRRTGSPIAASGNLSEMLAASSSPLASARAASDAASASARRRGEISSRRNTRPLASARAASTMSAVSRARCSAVLLIAVAQRRSRPPSSELAGRSLSARMPVSGVRISWAMSASAASIARGCGDPRRAARRARRGRLPADVLFLGIAPPLTLPRRRTRRNRGVPRFRAWLHKASIQADHAADVAGGRAIAAPRAPRARPRRCCELVSLGGQDQAMMVVLGCRKAEQRLQQPMRARGLEQILPAHDMGHALQRVVDHDRQVVAGRRLLARQHHVAPLLRRCRDRSGLPGGPAAGLAPPERPGPPGRRRHVEPERVGLARRHASSAFGARERASVAGIERRAVGVARPGTPPLARGDEPRDLAAALEARIGERVELRQRRAVIGEMRALAPDRLLPGDTEPGEVFVDRLLIVRPAARRVDVLDPQDEPP